MNDSRTRSVIQLGTFLSAPLLRILQVATKKHVTQRGLRGSLEKVVTKNKLNRGKIERSNFMSRDGLKAPLGISRREFSQRKNPTTAQWSQSMLLRNLAWSCNFNSSQLIQPQHNVEVHQQGDEFLTIYWKSENVRKLYPTLGQGILPRNLEILSHGWNISYFYTKFTRFYEGN